MGSRQNLKLPLNYNPHIRVSLLSLGTTSMSELLLENTCTVVDVEELAMPIATSLSLV